MFRFLKNLFGGNHPASAGQSNPKRIEITKADLQNVSTLGPRVVEILQARPEVRDAVFDPATVMLRVTYADDETQTMMLENLLTVLRQKQGTELAGYLDNYLSRADFTPGAEGYLLPVLKPVSYIAQTRQSFIDAGMAAEDMPLPYHLDFAPGLVMVFVRDTPSWMHVLSEKEIAEMGLDAGQLLDQALGEFGTLMTNHPLEIQKLAEGRLLQFQLDGNYEASIAFLGDVWDGVSQDLGGMPGVAFVARDIVLAVNADDPDSVRLLREMLSPDAGDLPPYPIAPYDIYVPSNSGGWTILAETEKATRVVH